MLLKLTSAQTKQVPTDPSRPVYVNTTHILKMGVESKSGGDDRYVYPHTIIEMVAGPTLRVLENPDTIVGVERMNNG